MKVIIARAVTAAGIVILSSVVLAAGLHPIIGAAEQATPVPTPITVGSWQAVCQGVVICVPFTPTPWPTPTLVTPASPTASATPAPSGTPGLPRTVKADADYVPRFNLIVRTSPDKTTTNATSDRAPAGQAAIVYYLRELPDGAVWGCLSDVVDWTTCKRWIAIQADLTGPNGVPDGVLEIYADPQAGPVS